MTPAEQPNFNPEHVEHTNYVEHAELILDHSQVFSQNLPQRVGIHYETPRTEIAAQILEEVAIRTLHFTDGHIPQSRYSSFDTVAGYSNISVRKIRLPDEGDQGRKPDAGYRGRIIDLSLRSSHSSDSSDDLETNMWQCSLYILSGQPPFLVDQAVRNLETEISDNSAAAVSTITKKVPGGALYYPNTEELLSLKVIIKDACLTQIDLARVLEECATEATPYLDEAAWFERGAVHIRELIRQQMELFDD